MAKALALAGTQSQPLGDPARQVAALDTALERLERDPDLAFPDWVVWQLRPESIEFWQGDQSRNHLRVHYQRGEAGWSTRRLWP